MPTRTVHVGPVAIGGGNPVSVQTMTKTDTRDAAATIAQIREISAAGCDIVRVAVPDSEAADALAEIVSQSPLPVIADIHFDHKLALKAVKNGVHGLRINPGNIGSRERVKAVAEACAGAGIPIRIGVNTGSLEKELLEKYGATPEAMVESAASHIRYLEELNFNDIKVSLKASDVFRTVAACRLFAKRFDYPQHIGVTEAGTEHIGLVKSHIGIGALLLDGIGDTIRVSLTAGPVKEVLAGREILRALGILPNAPKFISCPTCGRLDFNIRKYAPLIEQEVEKLGGAITVAVMGCAVNGPGEAKEADVALCGAKGYAAIYKKGRLVAKTGEQALVETFMHVIEEVLEEKSQNTGRENSKTTQSTGESDS
ncbi:MAG: flavodoxin-dependent (E)-4-hydroxy-3-methylbut-2-enyl-diphosphate synthase [Acidobacteria bacterium]|nr:flavodoxin-dependent (E)-4-hydroxy-3-methylbut-2-enyl-diphosphate synthase [Acidobacteriota bacterium]